MGESHGALEGLQSKPLRTHFSNFKPCRKRNAAAASFLPWLNRTYAGKFWNLSVNLNHHCTQGVNTNTHKKTLLLEDMKFTEIPEWNSQSEIFGEAKKILWLCWQVCDCAASLFCFLGVFFYQRQWMSGNLSLDHNGSSRRPYASEWEQAGWASLLWRDIFSCSAVVTHSHHAAPFSLSPYALGDSDPELLLNWAAADFGFSLRLLIFVLYFKTRLGY